MRRVAWWLLALFAFAIPWEYSLDLGEPFGNVARIAGLLLLLAAVPALLQAGSLRRPDLLQWLVLAFYLWSCCTYFWTVDPVATLERMRAYFQVMMTVWLVWEFAESPKDLRVLLTAFVAGSWVLAILTLANFASPEAVATSQVRFAATGQNANEVARFLDIGFPCAALLLSGETNWAGRLLALGYLPIGLVAVVLTASRGGFLAAAVALAGCGVLLARRNPKVVLAGVLALPVLAAALWYAVPVEIFERLATIPEQLQSGDLNQRVSIWSSGWDAFVRSPLLGSGAGSFVSAAGLAPSDTAHNTALAVAVNSGLLGLFLAAAIVAAAIWALLQTRGPLRLAMGIALLVWAITAMVASVEENRTTWLLFALIALAGRFADEQPDALEACFPDSAPEARLREARFSEL
jgi:O-antigen ligase